jgi:hypothetical protein
MMIAMMLAAMLSGPPLGVIEEKPHISIRYVDQRVQVVRPYKARLIRMAYCESTGRWHIATGNGFYGGLQFTISSWRAVGGKGYPHHASRLEQMYRAVKLMRIQGWGAWPVCQFA